MKKLFVVFGFAAISAMAADVSGFVMDKKCSANKAMIGNEACAKCAFIAARVPRWHSTLKAHVCARKP